MSEGGSRRVGLLGGAFNPPHLGHLKLAELAWQNLSLDELRLIPSANPPHKSVPDSTPEAALRLELLREALVGTPFGLETLELDRGGPSYTVETLEALSVREPRSAWIWVLGGDQLAQFTSWKRWERILELASLAVAPRPGFEGALPEELAGRLRETWSGESGELVCLPSTQLELSSSELRAGFSAGRSPEGIPIQVRAAIDRENLYR